MNFGQIKFKNKIFAIVNFMTKTTFKFSLNKAYELTQIILNNVNTKTIDITSFKIRIPIVSRCHLTKRFPQNELISFEIQLPDFRRHKCQCTLAFLNILSLTNSFYCTGILVAPTNLRMSILVLSGLTFRCLKTI